MKGYELRYDFTMLSLETNSSSLTIIETHELPFFNGKIHISKICLNCKIL